MIKKKMQFDKKTLNKNQSHISGDLNYSKNDESNENLVRINFEISEELRNAFKSKAAKHGKKIKDVMKSLMIEYVRKNETE
jgi:hypothetical protein